MAARGRRRAAMAGCPRGIGLFVVACLLSAAATVIHGAATLKGAVYPLELQQRRPVLGGRLLLEGGRLAVNGRHVVSALAACMTCRETVLKHVQLLI